MFALKSYIKKLLQQMSKSLNEPYKKDFRSQYIVLFMR